MIFGKRLYLVQRNDKRDPNTRFAELLRITGLEEESVEQTHLVRITTIDFSKMNVGQFDAERKKSWGILQGVLQG